MQGMVMGYGCGGGCGVGGRTVAMSTMSAVAAR